MIPSLAAAAGAGALLSLAFPPVSLHFIAWIAFVPFFWALARENRPGWAALHGGAFGLVFFLVDLNWIHGTLVSHGGFAWITASPVFLGMVLVLALFPATFGLVVGWFETRGIRAVTIAPFAWTGLEYARSVVLTGFPWDLTGYSQTKLALLMQLADTTGIYGISFLVILCNASAWSLLSAWISRNPIPWRLLSTFAAVLLISVVYGGVRLSHYPRGEDSADGVPIGILQGNIAQEVKWEKGAREFTFLTYQRLGEKAVTQGARLLVWPETSVPVLFGGNDPDWMRAVAISEKLGVPMLVGAPSCRIFEGATQYYNSAFLINGRTVLHQYDKIHLVPFGEYMPLTWLLPLGPGIAAREGDYSAGDAMTVMRLNRCPPFGVLICYEAIFPELARAALANGAKMLINLTNDGWYGRSAAPYQHLELARVRSIENRVWLLRAANTGISAAFDPAGRAVGTIPLQEEGVLIVKVPTSPPAGSFYSRFGDVFAWGCIAVCSLAILSAVKSRWIPSAPA
jgi:apolipoprotein N-acyltransferase